MVMQFATTSNSGTGKSPGGKPDQDAGAALAGHLDALLERGERGRGDQDAVRAAAGCLLQRGRGIACFALTTKSAPRCLACASLPSSMSTAQT